MIIEYISRFRDYLRGEVSIKKLQSFGLKVGKNFNRLDGCIIDYSHAWLITIGDNVTLAPRVHILAHDASTKMHLGYTKIGLVNIGNNVFIGAGATILPNVTIGDNVIIGAGSVVSKNVESNSIVAGNPAKFLSTIEGFIKKNETTMENRPIFNKEYTTTGHITYKMKQEMIRKLENGIGYVE